VFPLMPHAREEPRRNFSGVKLYDAQEEEASQQEKKNKFFIGGLFFEVMCIQIQES
jgi:hypothetical protein